MSTERVDRAIYLKSGSYWVVKRNKWLGPHESLEAARVVRDSTEQRQAPKPEGGPFEEFMKKYYYPHFLSKMKVNTQRTHQPIIEKSILPFFKSKRVADITSLDIMEFQQHLLSNGIAPITVNHRIGFLGLILKRAIELGFIKANPVSGVKSLREEQKDREVLTEQRIVEVVAAIEHPYKYAVALAGLAGARAGEVMGFRWEDLDLGEKPRISFERQINMDRRIDELKSKASVATLPMVLPLRDLLLEWKKQCPDAVWLFQGKVRDYIGKLRLEGGELGYKYHRQASPKRKYEFAPATSISGWWWKSRKSLGLPSMRFHDLRHSFATNVVTRCKNIKLAQRLCRHNTIEMTLEIYTHVHPEQFEEVWDWAF